MGLLGLCFNLLIAGPGALKLAWAGKVGDFPSFYVSFKLAQSNQPYNVEKTLQMQESIIGERRPRLLPIRLPFYFKLLSPLGMLPYSLAYRVWLGIIALAAILAFALYPVPDRFSLIAAALASLPLFQSLLVVQDVTIVFLVLACGLVLRKRGARFAAGLVLSLLSIKFHLFLLIPVLFLLRREIRIIAGMAAGGVALAIFSFAAAGPTWPRDYWKIISNPIISPRINSMPNLAAVGYYFGGIRLELVLAATVVSVVALIALRADFESSLAAALIGSLLISHHSYIQDATVLIPALVAVQARRGVTGGMALICLTPLPYFLAIQASLGIITATLLFAILIALSIAVWTKRSRLADDFKARQ